MEELGKKVRYFREAKGFSIKRLADGLCDDSTIYRLEKGKQLPRLEILNDICMKLEIPFQALFPFNEKIEALKKRCRDLVYNEDYLTLEIVLKECEEVAGNIKSTYAKKEFEKFISWHKAIVLHKREIKVSESLNILNSLVTLESCVSEMDFSILNSIGLINLSIKNFEAALEIYEVIYEKVKSQTIREDLTLLPRVGYNYADALYKLKNYEKALVVIQDVLNYVKKNNLIYLLGEIYHMEGMISKKSGDLNSSSEALKNAVLVFTLTKDKINLARTEMDLKNLFINSKGVSSASS